MPLVVYGFQSNTVTQRQTEETDHFINEWRRIFFCL